MIRIWMLDFPNKSLVQ